MKFNFKKVASVLASAVMLTSTVGFAAASNYPAPFTSGAAIVYGSGAAPQDTAAAILISNNLGSKVTTSTSGTTATTSGETAPLFTGSTKIYANDTLNTVKSVITKADMPTTLKDYSFSGNVDATVSFTIVAGNFPVINYGKQPTSSQDPQFGIGLSTTAANYLYNATSTFSKSVNFTHADSKNQELILFGQKYTVSSGTTNTDLILLKSATKINLDSSGTTSQEVEIAGKKYTVELVSASATAATIKVTDESGGSEQKEINEGYSKKVQGVTVAINTADSNNLKYTAAVVAGAEKITLTNGASITYGDSNSVIDGTKVIFDNADLRSGTSKITVSLYAPNSDKDTIVPGTVFTDPVFGTFKVDFAGLNVPENSTSREEIKIRTSGDDKMTLDVTDYNGNSIVGKQWAYNNSGSILLQLDTSGHNIIVGEGILANRSDWIVVGNEADGHLIEVSRIYNDTATYTSDAVRFKDVFSGDNYDTVISAEGTGSVVIGGKSYSVTYYGDNSLTEESKQVRLNYPDSSSANDMVVYPTIKTSKGAKIAFYKPLTITMTAWDGTNTLAGGNVKFPKGDGSYQNAAFAYTVITSNWTIDSTTVTNSSGGLNGVGSMSQTRAVSRLTYNFTISDGTANANKTTLYLVRPGGGNIVDPAIIILEPKDDNSNYEALVTTLTGGGATSASALQVSDVYRTWLPVTTTGLLSFRDALYTDTDITKEADLYGAVVTLDSNTASHKTASISMPSEQIYGQVYIAANDAVITPGTTGGATTTGAVTIITDTDVASYANSNLIVVGGSCINEAALKIIDSAATKPLCGADFTIATKVEAGQYIIKTVASPYATAGSGKVAMLVAGYEAEQTTLAAKRVLEGVDTTVDKEIIEPVVATSA